MEDLLSSGQTDEHKT